MTKKTIREIALAWKEDKQRYVKQSTYAAYALILENHIMPVFGEYEALSEELVQEFVLQKLDSGLSTKTVKDILIVLKMVMKFGVKNEWMNYCEWDIKYPTIDTTKEMEVLTIANHKKNTRLHQAELHFPQPWHLHQSDHWLAYRRDLWLEMVGHQHRQRHNNRKPYH